MLVGSGSFTCVESCSASVSSNQQSMNAIFYCGRVVFVLYTDDSIIMEPDEAEIDALIEKMKQSGLDLTVEGELADFLGVNIKKLGW